MEWGRFEDLARLHAEQETLGVSFGHLGPVPRLTFDGGGSKVKTTAGPTVGVTGNVHAAVGRSHHVGLPFRVQPQGGGNGMINGRAVENLRCISSEQTLPRIIEWI